MEIPISVEDMLQRVERLLKEYSGTTNTKAVCRQSNYFVVLCTPIMLRVHEKIAPSSELVICCRWR
jgi:hypothetical protein